MTRFEEIDKFLLKMAKIIAENPKTELDKSTIYYYLKNYGLSEEEIATSKLSMLRFLDWEKAFEGSNLKVFEHDLQPSFLQFHSKKDAKHDSKCAKLYVSFSKEDIKDAVIDIFKFISKEDMSTYSKVADKIRSDAVVLRMMNPEEAKKVIEFINNNPNLSSKAKPTNPFVYRCGKVGMGYDDKLSYNSTLASTLSYYFKNRKRTNRLSEVSAQDFKKYVEAVIEQIFMTKEIVNVESFRKECEATSYLHRKTEDVALNYEEILVLINKSLDPNMKLEDYFTFLNNCKNENLMNEKREGYKKKMDQSTSKEDITETDITLLDCYIMYAKTKYGKEIVPAYLELYCNGNILAITRDNNFRAYFMETLTPTKVKAIVGDNINEYVNKVINKESIR